MRQFRYLRDPLFLLGCLAYAINRWLVKPHVQGGFFNSYFNDCWLIPCALPPILWLHRRLGLRADDSPPGIAEVLSHLVFWSLLFEWIGPKFVSHAVGDPFDVVAYALGAIVAGGFWNRERWISKFSFS
jgi:hypothetical protein